MKNNQLTRSIIERAPSDQKPILEAIMNAFQLDGLQQIDDLFEAILNRRFNPFDIVYIDLAIDRSTTPLELSGAGTIVGGVEATDNLSVCTLSFQNPDQDPNRRVTVQRGKFYRLPYTKIFVYHAAQPGKYLKILRATSTPSFAFGVEDYSGADANSELVQALGNSSAIAPAQISVANTATVIKAANAARKRITIKNPSTGVTVYVGTSGVTTANGHILEAGDALTLNTTAAVYGIVASGTNTVSYLEE